MFTIDYFIENLPVRFRNAIMNTCSEEIEIARGIERRRVEDAIMYALDEDGHTGDWKLKFAKDYIIKHYENSPH